MNDQTTVPVINIMISSTTRDLNQYRKNAFEILNKLAEEQRRKLQLTEIGMETESQTGERETAIKISKDWVEGTNWLVLVLGWWYGTIPKNENENQEGLSPTHWEYRHAMELMEKNPKRKVFVFVTGEKNTADAYRATIEENYDLKDFQSDGDDEQKKKIREFREEVSGSHLSYFKNLDDFTTKLEKTLRDAITEWEKEQGGIEERLGKGLAGLILEFKLPIKTCIRKVRLLADYKEIHDQLHNIRQLAIRPWREIVIPQWNEDCLLDETMKEVLRTAGHNSSKFLASIKTILKNDPSVDDKLLLLSLEKVIKMDFDEDKDFASSIERFSNNVDLFSSRVQAAFMRANAVMQDKRSSLYDLREQLANSLSSARKNHALTPKDDELFNKWVDEIRQTRIRLDGVLKTHNNWQSLHDELERVDEARMSEESFHYQLKHFCDNNLELLDTLISDWTAQLSSINNKAYEQRVSSLESKLADLRKDSTLETYDAMKKAFDNVFYDVDRFTLDQVKKSKAKVDDFDQLLDELGQRSI